MKRIVRLFVCCCLGLLVPAVIFPWLVQALVPVKKPTSKVTFTPNPDTTREVVLPEPKPVLKAR